MRSTVTPVQLFDEMQKTAHLRHTERTNQCELQFQLFVKTEHGELDTDVKSVRKITDTVGSLLQHTKNKIHKLFQDCGWTSVEKDITAKFESSGHAFSDEINFGDTMIISNDTTCERLFKLKQKLWFYIFEEKYEIVKNAPLITTLKLPKVLYACTTLKPVVRAIFLDVKCSQMVWSRSRDKNEWIIVGREFFYTPSVADIGCYLKFCYMPSNHNKVAGEPVEVISESVVEVLPNLSLKSINSRHKFTKKKLTNNEYRIVSYNTLAERYTLDEQFSYCDSGYLSMEYRKQLLIHELLGYNADVILLQEMESATYSEFFKVHLQSSGYASSYHKKGKVLSEGLACMFDKSRFKRLDNRHIVLAHELKQNSIFSDVWATLKRNKDLRDAVLKQHTSLFVIALQCHASRALLVIANTHLFYHSEAGNVRLIQAIMACRYIANYCKQLEKHYKKISVIFCGDFNSLPDSAVFHYMTNDNNEVCLEELKRNECSPNILKRKFNFASAYGTPKFTNYTELFKGCLDYVFYEKEKMRVTQVVPIPAEEELSAHTALPSPLFPSDHVALVVDFKL